MENTYQNPPANQVPEAPVQKPIASYTKSTPAAKKQSSSLRVIGAFLALAAFFVVGLAGILVSQKQYISDAPVAPNAPESTPLATSVMPSECTLTFTVPTLTPTPTPTPTPSTTPTPTPTPTPSTSPTPTPTPALLSCGQTPCENNASCSSGLICVTADNGNKYCARPEFQAACADNPSVARCCGAVTSTPTPTTTLIATPSTQPEMPEELPQSGPADWLNYLQAGLAALGVGALLLLLL